MDFKERLTFKYSRQHAVFCYNKSEGDYYACRLQKEKEKIVL